jgi:hypothetical protein
MIVAMLAVVAASSVPSCGPAPSPVRADSLEALYRGGVPFADFLAGARARRQLWQENWGRAQVPAELLERARAIPGTWRLLAVSVDGCSDSVSTIPFIAKLVEQVDSLDMRVIGNVAGRPLMEAHRTPDGRPATPTLILLDARGAEAGCWIERPAPLQAWYLENQKTLESRDLIARKMEWYRTDAGVTTLREIVEMLEAAARGEPACVPAPGAG